MRDKLNQEPQTYKMVLEHHNSKSFDNYVQEVKAEKLRNKLEIQQLRDALLKKIIEVPEGEDLIEKVSTKVIRKIFTSSTPAPVPPRKLSREERVQLEVERKIKENEEYNFQEYLRNN